jgi:hypothetical protein
MFLNCCPGYLNLYNAGWLHRDISDGNIVILDRATQLKPLSVDVNRYPE